MELGRRLRLRRARPGDRRTGEQGDKVSSPHSMTPSARVSTAVGIVSPSAFAVVKLTTRSNFVGCSTGMSSGFAPRLGRSSLYDSALPVDQGSRVVIPSSLLTASRNEWIWATDLKWCTRFEAAASTTSRRYLGVRLRWQSGI